MTTLPSIAFSYALLTIGAWLGYYAGRSDARSMRRYRSITFPDPSPARQKTNPYSGAKIPNPEIAPKPQPSGGRMIGADGTTIDYRSIPSRPDANPPLREP